VIFQYEILSPQSQTIERVFRPSPFTASSTIVLFDIVFLQFGHEIWFFILFPFTGTAGGWMKVLVRLVRAAARAACKYPDQKIS
jgi:hypothetical protein